MKTIENMVFENKATDVKLIPIVNDLLQTVYPELAQINDVAWLQCVERARYINVAAGSLMLHDLSRARDFKLLMAGTVRVYQAADDGREITLYRVKAGDLCILSLNSLFHEDSGGIISEAETDIALLCISEKDFHIIMRESDTFRNYVLTHLNKRAVDLMAMIQDTAFNTLALRLACLLGRLFEREQTEKIKMTHQLLAHELGTTREVVSRILKGFERQGCIRLSRGYIQLASQEVLSSFSRMAHAS